MKFKKAKETFSIVSCSTRDTPPRDLCIMTLPVVSLPSSPPNPKSSVPLCTTIALPIIDLSPHKDIRESFISIKAFPF